MKNNNLPLIATRTEARLHLQQHNLTAALAHVSIENSSNHVPYHNLDHLLVVTKWCARLCHMLKVPHDQTRAVLLAAIFHDYDHSGGTEADSVNIERAVAGLQAFAGRQQLESKLVELAVECIRVTEFPFVHEPTNLIQQIIRDADLLQSTESNFEDALLGGLRKEIEVKFKRKISRKEFAHLQNDFMDREFHLFTEPAKVIYAAARPYIRARFDDIASGKR